MGDKHIHHHISNGHKTAGWFVILLIFLVLFAWLTGPHDKDERVEKKGEPAVKSTR